MNNIVKIDAMSACPDLTTIEEILDELGRFGQPSLWKGKHGWYCRVEMFIQGEGIAFEVKSESNHARAFSAAQQCMDRMRIALRDISEKAKP